jgi:hypothetical protein
MPVSTEQTIRYEIQSQNERIINEYIDARKTETNLAESTQRVMIDNLKRFSRHLNKDLKKIIFGMSNPLNSSFCSKCGFSLQ